jgi:hyaluronoglucosaminidase
MYGAKSDPYHSHYWDQPYPKRISAEQKRIGMMTEDMMRHLTDVAHQSKVNFIWAIHPGQSFTNANSTDVLDRIMEKFQKMYDLGVRQFGVFVDDVGVPTDEPTLTLGANRLTRLQEMQDERWNRPGAAPADTVKPLQYVPQLYAFSWVDQETARKFWESLRPVSAKTSIYTTGYRVWSVPNSKDVDVLNDYLGREVSWWWNYPCNDNDMTKIFVADTYSNFADESKIVNSDRMEPGLNLKTIILNPMQQGEISKIALFSVADYAWNNAAFNNHRSWEAALPAVVGKEKAAVLRHLAPYLRYFDADALAYEVRNYRRSVTEGHPRPGAVINLLRRVLVSCDALSELEHSPKQSDRLFYEDLRPWLLKLKAMAAETVERLEGKQPAPTDFDNNPDFQFPILTGLGDGIQLSVKTAEPAAEVLMPLLLWLRGE